MTRKVVRLAAVRRLKRMRRSSYVRALARRAIEDVGGGQAVLVAGHKARLKGLLPEERRLWAEVEAELGRRVGYTWWWGDEDAAG